MQVMEYVKPELIIVSVVLYLVGVWIKQMETIKDKYIPMINGGLGIIICAVYVLATSELDSGQTIAMAAFIAITQGILTAGLSTYVNQLIKQTEKYE